MKIRRTFCNTIAVCPKLGLRKSEVLGLDLSGKPSYRERKPMRARRRVKSGWCSLRGIGDEVFSVSAKELIQTLKGAAVRFTRQQIAGLRPQEWIEGVGAILLTVGTLPDEQTGIGAVPKMIGVGVKDGWRECRLMLCACSSARRGTYGGSKQ
jgi:hypothetical protein